MALWERLRQELDRAGRTASEALDEGRVRLDLHRARQTADRFAQRLGYALFRARESGRDLTPEEFETHAGNLRKAEADVTRFQAQVDEAAAKRKAARGPQA